MSTTQTPAVREVRDLGEVIGKIAAFAAMSLHESFPNLGLEGLVVTFTGAGAQEFIGRRFVAVIEDGKTTGEAAGEAGEALLYAWAEARLEARTQLDRERGRSAP
ncbi:hypothetical protein [Streptomyces sp. NPDC092952]|uniref:hypothetical protein n=1 Tax=Streptomyces sp. NPDC092952 TaxID=3366018 RepID=UPI003804A4ED